jgi:hypothetical protein
MSAKLADVIGIQIVGLHQGQRQYAPHQQAGHMTAVDQIVQNAKKSACQGRPSTYDEIDARDMMMMPQFPASHPRKE